MDLVGFHASPSTIQSKHTYKSYLVNWYRMSRRNYDDELPILDRNKLTQPLLFITATNDNALPPSMSRNLDKVVPQLTRGEVDASHWAQWEKPEECNRIIKGWIEEVVFGGKSML